MNCTPNRSGGVYFLERFLRCFESMAKRNKGKHTFSKNGRNLTWTSDLGVSFYSKQQQVAWQTINTTNKKNELFSFFFLYPFPKKKKKLVEKCQKGFESIACFCFVVVWNKNECLKVVFLFFSWTRDFSVIWNTDSLSSLKTKLKKSRFRKNNKMDDWWTIFFYLCLQSKEKINTNQMNKSKQKQQSLCINIVNSAEKVH